MEAEMSDNLERLRHELEALKEEHKRYTARQGEQIGLLHNRVCDAIKAQETLPPAPVPEKLTEAWMRTMESQPNTSRGTGVIGMVIVAAAARLRYLEARVEEMEKAQELLLTDAFSNEAVIGFAHGALSYAETPQYVVKGLAREIARRRGLKVPE
jgi:chromosome segregation ATPase